MDHPFEKLHEVRLLREQLAQSDLAKGRQQLDQAADHLLSEQTNLEHYRSFKSEMEVRLFDAIGRKAVTLNEFESYRGRVSHLRAGEINRRESVRQAEAQKAAAREMVERLSAAFQRRCRESVKLKELHGTWKAKVEEEKTRAQDEEMEETALNRFARNVVRD